MGNTHEDRPRERNGGPVERNRQQRGAYSTYEARSGRVGRTRSHVVLLRSLARCAISQLARHRGISGSRDSCAALEHHGGAGRSVAHGSASLFSRCVATPCAATGTPLGRSVLDASTREPPSRMQVETRRGAPKIHGKRRMLRECERTAGGGSLVSLAGAGNRDLERLPPTSRTEDRCEEGAGTSLRRLEWHRRVERQAPCVRVAMLALAHA